jgi:hypothetical protein
VLERFDTANLHHEKCVISQPAVKNLGYVLSDKRVSTSSDKENTVKNYPNSRNTKDVRAFLGLASFYRRLVPNFVQTAKPLTKLMRKGQEFNWAPGQQEALEEIKTKHSTTPGPAYPNFDLPFILTTVTSMVAVAAILHRYRRGWNVQSRTLAGS